METNIKSKSRVQLVNPWSGACPDNMLLTWKQVSSWAKENVHYSYYDEWIKEARKAFRNDDGETLGIMIIGS